MPILLCLTSSGKVTFPLLLFLTHFSKAPKKPQEQQLVINFRKNDLTLSVSQDFHGCTMPFFIYAQNIMVYNLTAHNYVSLKDNPNKVYIKLKGIGCTV